MAFPTDRPKEWRNKYVLAWDDGTIEPKLFDTAEAARDCWRENVRGSGQTVEVVVRENFAEHDLWREIDIALANAETAARDHMEEPARLYYAKLRDRMREVFLHPTPVT